MSTVRMNAATIGGTLNLAYTGAVTVPSDGIISVDTRDAPALLARGASYINLVTRKVSFSAVAAASAGRLVASTALSNGTKAVANQPDVPRQGVLRIDPGTSAITAGTVSIPYVANDGTSVTDVVSAIMPGTTVVSTLTSKGIMVLSPIVVAGIAGGASPLVQLNDTNSLSMPVDAGFVDFTLLRTDTDAALTSGGTVATSAASVTPTSAPAATTTYNFFYSYTMPNT